MAKKTVAEHLQEFHQKSKEHHLARAISSGVQSKLHERMAARHEENDDSDASEDCAKLAEQCATDSENHKTMAAYHNDCAKSFDNGNISPKQKVDATKTATSTALSGFEHFVAPSGGGDE